MLLVAPPLISLFFFSGFVVAGLYAPDCSLTWKWSFNSLGQNACTVAAYMMSTCHGGSFTVEALPRGYHYTGPYVSQGADLCMCNTIAYSLLSACDGCQGSDWISWSNYAYNCTRTLPPSSFPNPIPAGTRLPRWALLDVTEENTWNANASLIIGDSPELGPGTIFGPAGSSPSTPTGPSTVYSPVYPSSSLAPQPPVPSTQFTGSLSYTVGSPSNTTTSTPGPVPAGYSVKGHSSNTGAIAGGTVAGIAAISIVVVALFFYRQRRRSLAQSAPAAGDGQAGAYYQHVDQVPSRPMSGQGTVTSSLPGTSTSMLRTYNPEDPSTFPASQGVPNPSFTSAQVPSLSNTRHLYTIATPPGPEGSTGI